MVYIRPLFGLDRLEAKQLCMCLFSKRVEIATKTKVKKALPQVDPGSWPLSAPKGHPYRPRPHHLHDRPAAGAWLEDIGRPALDVGVGGREVARQHEGVLEQAPKGLHRPPREEAAPRPHRGPTLQEQRVERKVPPGV